ncbi:Clp protease ClpP [Flavobacteriaceae bacterium]|nr:Clp protease ClpP [Flavobacteriaceae bacterium]
MKWQRTNEESDSDTDDENIIKTVGCDIFFHAEVNRKNIFSLIENIKKLEIELMKKAVDLHGYDPEIRLFIHSEGGDVYSGFSAMDHIQNSRVNITTIADGCCASAGTFILLAGKTRMMNPHSYILIHQISSGGFWGKFEELKDEIHTCTKIMDMVKSVYTDKTKIPDKKLKTLMKRDVYLSSEECLQYQIVSGLFYP